jgi:hypothetical protein
MLKVTGMRIGSSSSIKTKSPAGNTNRAFLRIKVQAHPMSSAGCVLKVILTHH